LQAIADQLDGDVILVNATSFTQRGLVLIPGDSFQRFRRDEQPLPFQEAESGVWVDAGELAPYSVVALQKTIDHRPTTMVNRPHLHLAQVQVSSMVILENRFIRVEFNQDG